MLHLFNTVSDYWVYHNILLVIFVSVGNQKAQIGEWRHSDWCPLSPRSVLRQSPHAGPDSPVLLWGPFLWGGGWLFFQGGVKTSECKRDCETLVHTDNGAMLTNDHMSRPTALSSLRIHLSECPYRPRMLIRAPPTSCKLMVEDRSTQTVFYQPTLPIYQLLWALLVN